MGRTGKQVNRHSNCSIQDIFSEKLSPFTTIEDIKIWVPEKVTFELPEWELNNGNCYHANNQTHTENIFVYFNLLALNMHNRATMSGLIIKKTCNSFVKSSNNNNNTNLKSWLRFHYFKKTYWAFNLIKWNSLQNV